MSGFFEIGVYQPKYEENIGTLMRSAYQLGASGVFTVGKRYKRQAGDIFNIAKHVPLRHYDTLNDLIQYQAEGTKLIGVEKGGEAVSSFTHPKRPIVAFVPDRCMYALSQSTFVENSQTRVNCEETIATDPGPYPR